MGRDPGYQQAEPHGAPVERVWGVVADYAVVPGVPLQPCDDEEGHTSAGDDAEQDRASFHLDRRIRKTARSAGGNRKKTMKLIIPKTIPAPTSAHSQKPTQPMG
jgi:hypothetical protein